MISMTQKQALARVPVVLYVRTTDAASGTRYLAEARRYAECRDWNVVAALSDLYDLQTLSNRPHWQQAEQLVTERQAGGVITRYSSMIAPARAMPSVRRWLLERGAFLVSTEGALS